MNIFDTTHITSTNSDKFNELIDFCIKDALEDNIFVQDIKYSTQIITNHIEGLYTQINIIEYSALIIFKK